MSGLLILIGVFAAIWLAAVVIFFPLLLIHHHRRLKRLENQIDDQNALLQQLTELVATKRTSEAGLKPFRIEPLPPQASTAEKTPPATPPPSPPAHAAADIHKEYSQAETRDSNASPSPSFSPPSFSEALPPVPETEDSRHAQQSSETAFLDLEERLGANWLLKIGMTLLVTGVALFLGYTFQRLGPAGKILIAAGLSVGGIITGHILEKSGQYTVFGRVLLSGGWALAYLTAYAMSHIQATKIIHSEIAGFAVLLATSAGMIIESIRFRSQLVTGFSYGLAYLALFVNAINWPVLFAGSLLTVSMIFIIRRLNWYAIEHLAIAATYVNHFRWLFPVIEPMGSAKQHFPDFWASTILLSLYWLAFTVSHFTRRPEEQNEQKHLQLSLILNAIGYIALSAYQSFTPEYAFAFLLVLGVIYFGLSYLSHVLKRPASFISTSTIGAILLIAAIPYRFAGNDLALLWLLQVESLAILGFRLRLYQFRRLAWLGSMLLAGYLIYQQIIPHLLSQSKVPFDQGFTLLLVASAFLLNSVWIGRRYADQIESQREKQSLVFYLYTGWSLTLVAFWFLVPGEWTAASWLVFAIASDIAGRRWQDRHLLALGQIGALLAAARLSLSIFFDSPTKGFRTSERLLAGIATVLLMYAFAESARRNQFQTEPRTKFQRIVNGFVATFLALIVCWHSLIPTMVAIAWGIISLTVWKVGRMLKRSDFVLQGHIVAVAAFLRGLVVNVTATELVGPVSVRLATMLPLAALFYYFFLVPRLVSEKSNFAESKTWGALNSWFGLCFVLELCRSELPPENISIAWALIGLALIVAERFTALAEFRWQSFVVTLMIVARGLFRDLRIPQDRLFSISATILILLFSFVVAHISGKTRDVESRATKGWLSRIAFQTNHVCFFAAVTLATALIWVEMSSGYRTAAWAIEGFLIFMITLIAKERIYRLTGLGFLLACTLKIVIIDVWKLETLQRIITFMLLGAILVLVSFFYAKYKDSWKRLILGH